VRRLTAATEKLSPPAGTSFTAAFAAAQCGPGVGASLRLWVPDRDPETAEEVIAVVPADWRSVRSRRFTGGALLVLTDKRGNAFPALGTAQPIFGIGRRAVMSDNTEFIACSSSKATTVHPCSAKLRTAERAAAISA